MAKYLCTVCEYIHDEEETGQKWDDLPDDWVSPVCDSPKSYFSKMDEAAPEIAPDEEKVVKETDVPAPIDLQKTMAEAEPYFTDIQEIARSSRTMDEPMRTKEPVISWDEILIKGAQLARIPLNHEEPVNTKTVIVPRAGTPLVIETPIYISHMSFGALSKQAKTALAKGSAAQKTLICSGEGGILPEEFEAAYRYIFEYVPNQYSVSEENLRKVDAIEIKIGQSAKPGLGGHLPGEKVTSEIARIRGFKEGEDIIIDAICSVPYLIGYIINYKEPLLNRERRVKELFKSFEDDKSDKDDSDDSDDDDSEGNKLASLIAEIHHKGLNPYAS